MQVGGQSLLAAHDELAVPTSRPILLGMGRGTRGSEALARVAHCDNSHMQNEYATQNMIIGYYRPSSPNALLFLQWVVTGAMCALWPPNLAFFGVRLDNPKPLVEWLRASGRQQP